MRKVKVNLDDLADALENASYEMTYVLDLETGEVTFTSEEDSRDLEEIYAELEGGEGVESPAFEKALARRDLPDWRKDTVREARRIAENFGTRYIGIDPQGSREGYSDMEAFIETVQDRQLQNRLERAIAGRGAFRMFKDVLLDYPRERERWFQFQAERQRERALEWLKEEGIEPILE